MRTVIFAALLCSLTAFSVAQGQPNSQDKENAQAHAAYEAAGDLGVEMFIEFIKQNGAIVRTAAALQACDQDGLAKAVEAKEKDRNFVDQLTKMVADGRFHDLPGYTALSAQSVANSMHVGYMMGYREAAKLAKRDKTNLCGAAVQSANDLLKH